MLMAVSRDGVTRRRLSLLTYDLVRLILRPKATFDILVVVKNSSTVMGASCSFGLSGIKILFIFWLNICQLFFDIGFNRGLI